MRSLLFFLQLMFQSVKRTRDEAKIRAFKNLAERKYNKLNKPWSCLVSSTSVKCMTSLSLLQKARLNQDTCGCSLASFANYTAKDSTRFVPLKTKMETCKNHLKRWKHLFCEVMNPTQAIIYQIYRSHHQPEAHPVPFNRRKIVSSRNICESFMLGYKRILLNFMNLICKY